MVLIKGLYYVNDYISQGYNNEFLKAVLQGLKFTFMDQVYEKDKKYYKYNDIP